MEWLGEIWRRLLFLFRRRQFDSDLEEELRFHLDMKALRNREDGMSEKDARFAAQRQFGNTTRTREICRTLWTAEGLEALCRDFRYALRTMSRRPAFTAVAVGSLAIALGANTAVFSFVNAVVLKTLPVADAGRLVVLRQQNEQFHIVNCCFDLPFFRELRRAKTDFGDILALSSTRAALIDRGETERVNIEFVSGNYFRMLGIRPAAGRLLDEGDDAVEGASPACVISYKLWQERFGGDAAAIGRRITLGDAPFQIAGVTQPGFSGAALHDSRDVQVPTAMIAAFWGDKRDVLGWELIARLKPGVTLQRAAARLNAIGKPIQKPAWKGNDFLLKDGSQGVNSDREQLGRPVLVLALLVGVLLLIACANVAALLLVRSVERTREAGMRIAMGASRTVLFRQFLSEAVLLAMAGTAAGWGLALVLMNALLRLLSPAETLAHLVRPNPVVFGFSAVAGLVAGMLFGWLPAWRASRADPLHAIHGTAFARPGRHALLSRVVVAAQIALSLALLFSAGLFTRTLRNLRAVDLGFRPENLVDLDVDLGRTAYEKQAGVFFDALLRRTRELPNTRAASLCSLSIVSGSMAAVTVDVPGYVPPKWHAAGHLHYRYQRWLLPNHGHTIDCW